ncbi:MAG TPA: recombination regulator RecX [Burkholderiales bacterium]|nr:recombination regulator RecX [Burkholderiales bacterium]
MKGAPDTPAELRTRALRYLARREHSRLELARKLAPHAESELLLEGLLSELEGRKLLSNSRFAENRAHVLSRKYGAARIRQDLKAKGVADHVAAAVTSVGDEAERARTILARKYREPAHSREEQAKRMRFLQSRGFSYDTIRSVMRVDEAE